MSKNAVKIIMLILSVIGLEVGEETVVAFLSALVLIITISYDIWKQIKRDDTTLFLWKTDKLNEEL